MSNGYRAQWKDDSIREAEVEHFKKLKAAENFLHRIMREATDWLDENGEARKSGVDPTEVFFGPRNADPEAPAPEPAPEKKPARPRPYKPRVYAPQMLALGTRAALVLVDLTPMILDQWKRLVEAGIDPRRLALTNHESKIAALLFDEIGVQYHDVDANQAQRIAEALDKLEAWVRKLKKEEKEQNEGESTGPPAAAAEPATPDTPPPVEPAPQEEQAKSGREPAPYSAGKESLDWTKL